MIRRISRELVVQSLFQIDFSGCSAEEALNVAVYEIYFAEEKIPAGIAINEAVEIAKIYGSEDSPRFINGLLGKMVRNNE